MKDLKSSKVILNAFDPSVGLDRGASKFKEGVWYLFKTIFILSSFPYPSSFKVLLLRLFGAKIGKGVVIKPRLNIHFPWKLYLGNHVWLGEEVFILNFEPVTIEDNVCVSQRAFLCGGNHDYSKQSFPYRNGSIILKSGCWIGASVFVGPNVTVGFDTVVSAGSVITKNLDANGVYRGNPIEYIKPRWSTSL